MKYHTMLSPRRTVLVLGAALPIMTLAQEVAIPQDCSATRTQLQAEKKLVMEFCRPDTPSQKRIALIDPTYAQDNPLFVKSAAENHLCAGEGIKQTLSQIAARSRPGGASGRNSPAEPGGAPPPQIQVAIVMAECELVTVIHKITIEDPTGGPRTTYEAFSFDTFRVRNGKLVGHWDDDVISETTALALRALKTPVGAPLLARRDLTTAAKSR